MNIKERGLSVIRNKQTVKSFRKNIDWRRSICFDRSNTDGLAILVFLNFSNRRFLFTYISVMSCYNLVKTRG